MVDKSWNYCTILNENETRFYLEDDWFIPEDAISLVIKTKNDLGGFSNEIAELEIHIHRKKVKTGNCKIKLQFKPGNGTFSINVLAAICLDVLFVPYGDVPCSTIKGNLKVNTTGLSSIANKETKNVTSASVTITDTLDYDEFYGFSADHHKSAEISFNNLDGGATLENFEFILGHTYDAFVYVAGESAYDVI